MNTHILHPIIRKILNKHSFLLHRVRSEQGKVSLESDESDETDESELTVCPFPLRHPRLSSESFRTCAVSVDILHQIQPGASLKA